MKNLKKLNFQEIEKKVLKKNEARFIDLNIDQLKHGQDANGGNFPEYSNDDYYKGKAAEGLLFQAGRRFNFILEGNFTEAFNFKQQGSDSFIDSTDSKRDKLVSLVSGQPIFGIQDKNLTKAENEFLTEDIEKEVLQGLQL